MSIRLNDPAIRHTICGPRWLLQIKENGLKNHLINQAEKSMTANMQYYFKIMESPVGPLRLVASDTGLAGILWKIERLGKVHLMPQIEDLNHPILLKGTSIKRIFSGKRTTFDVRLVFKDTPCSERCMA